MLSQLVYRSKRTEKCTDEEIDKILDACKRNNHGKDITGVLLYSDKHFVQYLEGDFKTINGLYDKIKDDDRHTSVVLLTTAPIKERTFPSWQMGSKKIDEDKVEFQTDISDEEAREFQEVLSGNKKESARSADIIKKFFDKEKA